MLRMRYNKSKKTFGNEGEKMNIALEVRNRINKFDEGLLIKYSDLNDITDNILALSKALSRMVKDKQLEKIEKGIFYKPKLSRFGKINPNLNEIIKKELEKDNEIVGYVTGVNLFNKLGLTTQISNVIEIATNKRKVPKEIMGNKIKFVQTSSKINKENIELLQLLDAIKNIKKIPDGNIEDSYKVLKYRINELNQNKQEKIRDLSLDYSPLTRAILGSILEEISIIELSLLEKSLNPFTKFNLDIVNIKNRKRWNIN